MNEIRILICFGLFLVYIPPRANAANRIIRRIFLMKKLIAVILALVMICSLAVSASAEIEINFWNGFTGSDGEILKEIVDEFNATNDKGIFIKIEI